jgi:hypothetical protein
MGTAGALFVDGQGEGRHPCDHERKSYGGVNGMNCKTDGAVYEIEIGRGVVSCKVFLPPTVRARLGSYEMAELRKQIHDAMEGVLAPYFPQYKEKTL